MKSAADLVVSVDCSTSASKAIVWDCNGNIISEGRASLPMLRPRPTWHEQPAESWWQATVEALCQAVAQVNPGRIASICITNQRETFVPVNEQGRPLRNAILWMDERAGNLLPKLARIYGAKRFHHITGKPLSGNLTVGKIAWLRINEPKVFADTHVFMDVQGYLVLRLTGNSRTSWGSADPMGLFDMSKNCWAEDVLSGLDVRVDQFPEAFPPGAKSVIYLLVFLWWLDWVMGNQPGLE